MDLNRSLVGGDLSEGVEVVVREQSIGLVVEKCYELEHIGFVDVEVEESQSG